MEVFQDLFISHATRDKELYIYPIADALRQRQIAFWLDEIEIGWGDSIAMKINEGLRTSRFVLVCLSEAFCRRPWPETEISSALALQNTDGVRRVLPLVLNSKEQVLSQYPLLAGLSYREYEGRPDIVAADVASLLAGPGPKGGLEIIVESVHTGGRHNLIVPARASVQWVLRQVQAQFGLNNVADTGGYTRFPIRWVLVDTKAEQEWLQIPRFEKQRIRAVVASENGVQIALTDSHRFAELGVAQRSTFHIYAIEDDELRPLSAIASA